LEPESQVESQVRTILGQVCAHGDVHALSDTDSLLRAGLLDSLAMVGLVAELERAFGVQVGEDELVPEHFDSVRAISSLVRAKVSRR
jgi:acyl carrier protein